MFNAYIRIKFKDVILLIFTFELPDILLINEVCMFCIFAVQSNYCKASLNFTLTIFAESKMF